MQLDDENGAYEPARQEIGGLSPPGQAEPPGHAVQPHDTA